MTALHYLASNDVDQIARGVEDEEEEEEEEDEDQEEEEEEDVGMHDDDEGPYSKEELKQKKKRKVVCDSIISTAQFLMKQGVDIHKLTDDQETAVKYALDSRNKPLALFLLNKGCAFTYDDQESSDNILHVLAKNLANYGQKKIFNILLKKDIALLKRYAK